MRIKVALVLASGVLIAASSVARVLAHHAFAAQFDATKVVTITGTITKVERINPHGWIYVDVKGPDGTIEEWGIETGAPSLLLKLGVKRDSLPIGEQVTVTGYRAKDGSNTANGNYIQFADGRQLGLGSSSTSTQPAK